ncbi:MAG: molecular chaperone HtpG [Ruminococcaceae bacterium]|nr:molecular chaperone HtpG [Oscillospiraceae bacterium]
MAKKQFKAESKRLLDLMIHSIYTHREIFLRELISNASDALDKLYYHSLQGGTTGIDRNEFIISIVPDAEQRTLTVTDNGIGMTKAELEDNLGTIAKSGSLAFKRDTEQPDDIDIIGQFGVGFYAAFMVADRVMVLSRAFGSDEAYQWESTGADGYTVTEAQKDTHGTVITLHIKDSTEDENYDEFLQPYRLKALVKRYSDYIRYPIQMPMPQSRLKDGCEGDKPEDYEQVTETQTLNSMVPLWRKNKNELTDEDYHNFYKEKFYDYTDPLRVIHSSTEGAATYNALMFVPAHAPQDFYSRDYEKGLQLYASGVLIMDKCADLLPDCFSFIKGLVDSQDLSLNISREMLQHDRQLKLIASRLEKKIKSELYSMQQNDRETYETFFKSFGMQLKYGVYAEFGKNKELLQDLLLFASSHDEHPTTLAEYLTRMKEEQTCIYYICGSDREKLARMPQAELVLDRGYEVLYLTEDVDEFCIRALNDYEGKTFKNVSDGDLGLETEEEKKQAEEQAEQHKDLLAAMTEALDGKVAAVRLSNRLKSHPVCLSSEGGLSLEMEKVLRAMPGEQAEQFKATRVLEINEHHAIWTTLQRLFDTDKEKLTTYTALLYDQALLIEGLPVEDPIAFSNALCALMTE